MHIVKLYPDDRKELMRIKATLNGIGRKKEAGVISTDINNLDKDLLPLN
jgi:hypothetical protein